MTVEHVGTSWQEGADKSLASAIEVAEKANTPLLVRLNLDLYDRAKQAYVKWRGQIWKVELLDNKQIEAVGLRDALALFFALYGRVGFSGVMDTLQTALDATRYVSLEAPTGVALTAGEAADDEQDPE